jgi:hypothetical protein
VGVKGPHNWREVENFQRSGSQSQNHRQCAPPNVPLPFPSEKTKNKPPQSVQKTYIEMNQKSAENSSKINTYGDICFHVVAVVKPWQESQV